MSFSVDGSDAAPYFIAAQPGETPRQRSNRHRKILNRMWNDVRTDHGVKCGRERLIDACNYILDRCTLDVSRPFGPGALMGDDMWDCWIAHIHADAKGRSRLSIRWNFTGAAYDERHKAHFRPWHVVWIVMSAEHRIPRGKSYSHLCHNECCVNPRHGVWETIGYNINRNFCQTASHVVVQHSDNVAYVYRVCPHEPPCLRPVVVSAASALAFPLVAPAFPPAAPQ